MARMIWTLVVAFVFVSQAQADLLYFEAESFDSTAGDDGGFDTPADNFNNAFSPDGGFGDTVIETPTGNFNGSDPDNTATYSLTFPASGDYTLYARVRVPETGGNTDSFFAPADFGGSPSFVQINDISDTETNGQYFWLDVSNGADANGGNPTSSSTGTYSVGSLSQTFVVGDRETDFRMDAFIFSTESLNGSQLEAEAFAAQPSIDGSVVTSMASQSGENGNVSIDLATFDFTGQPELASLEALAITLQLDDGDTNAGDFAEDTLSLELDGFDTGILLNGFGDSTDGLFTLTIGGIPNNAADILAALQADNQLLATLVDGAGNNGVTAPSSFTATLSLVGEVVAVPEPATGMLLGLGLVAFMSRRRRLQA